MHNHPPLVLQRRIKELMGLYPADLRIIARVLEAQVPREMIDDLSPASLALAIAEREQALRSFGKGGAHR